AVLSRAVRGADLGGAGGESSPQPGGLNHALASTHHLPRERSGGGASPGTGTEADHWPPARGAPVFSLSPASGRDTPEYARPAPGGDGHGEGPYELSPRLGERPVGGGGSPFRDPQR